MLGLLEPGARNIIRPLAHSPVSPSSRWHRELCRHLLTVCRSDAPSSLGTSPHPSMKWFLFAMLGASLISSGSCAGGVEYCLILVPKAHSMANVFWFKEWQAAVKGHDRAS